MQYSGISQIPRRFLSLWNYKENTMNHYDMLHKIYLLKEEVIGRDWHGHGTDPEFTPHVMAKGSKVKVVMCSRFGDVGITPNLDAEYGYIARVDPEELTEE